MECKGLSGPANIPIAGVRICNENEEYHDKAAKRGNNKYIPWLPIATLPLFLAGPKGAVAYFAVNLAACGSPEDEDATDAGASPDQIPDASSHADGDAGSVPDHTPTECKPGDFRPCGPCELGIEACGNDFFWTGNCEGLTQSILDEPRFCYSGEDDTEGVGQCHGGTTSCKYDPETGEWDWGICEGEVLPQAESCEGLDNDCDGKADEGPDDEEPWTSPFYSGPRWTEGRGICHAGRRICAGGEWMVELDEVVPAVEICDRLDNDCDGDVDEGLVNACGMCGPVPAEMCNGIDDDCDGQIDEDTESECGGCQCIDGACGESLCIGEASCGQSDGCGDICQSCPPGEVCTEQPHGHFCLPSPLDCMVTDRFLFGNDFSSHEYVSSDGVQAGISPQDSCGAALGIYFEDIGDWAQISMAVSADTDAIRLTTYSSRGGVTIQADGFECGRFACWTDNLCRPHSHEWHMHELIHNIALDGAVDFVFRSGVVGANIAIAEVESCYYIRN